ncbi:MAG TPA: GxxExxY protein [Longimicrobiales bacterium]
MDPFLEHLATEAVDAAMKLHIRVGPGLVEKVYEALLADALKRRGLQVERQKPVPLVLDGHRFGKAFRLDILVEGQLPIEVKSADVLLDTHWKQLLTYLRLMDLRLGLLINFGEARLKDGLKRVVNRYDGFGP